MESLMKQAPELLEEDDDEEEEEEEEEEGGPSSVEAQADPSDLNFDLELDLADVPAPTYPLVNHNNHKCSSDIFSSVDESLADLPLAGLFDPLEPTPASSSTSNNVNVKAEGAVAGICGFHNFANTCYMNSGLQCLLATPTMVKYFTDDDDLVKLKCKNDGDEGDNFLVGKFAPLIKDVWAGEYSLLKPVNFKESLACTHPQFAGAHQHDCQEFLALLLDTMHEELRAHKTMLDSKGSNSNNYSECGGTSMELHTPHSTEKEAVLSMSWLSRHSSLDDSNKVVNGKNRIVSDVVQDGTDSRGSASSPKSFDSQHSSIEDKVATAIRQLPIPNEVKYNPHNNDDDSGRGDESMPSDEDESIDREDDDDTMDSNSSSNQPTCNLVAPDSLKKRQHSTVRLSEEEQNNSSGGGQQKVSINDYYLKENKTLNVNVLAEDSDEMNNEISFDSEKFSKMEKTRPQETIDNLNPTAAAAANGAAALQKVVNVKRFKTSNMHSNEAVEVADEAEDTCGTDNSCDFNAIKRMRLDSSSEKEKNIQLEMERQSTSGGASSLLMPPSSPTLDPARLKEAIEADRYWEKYLAINDTVVARTFQGQFKSSVVCSVCHYVSVNFEPFMYLPVPLPNANVRQVNLTFVSPSRKPTSFLLDMTQADNVGKLKEKLAEVVEVNNKQLLHLVEVLDHHISRVVDDWTMLKCLKEDRQIYIMEGLTYEMSLDQSDQPQTVPIEDQKTTTTTISSSTEYQSCVICMEDLPADQLRQHNACDCVMCSPCLERTVEHHQSDTSQATKGGHIKCPGCRQEAEPGAEFVTLDQIGKCKPKLRQLSLPVVCRLNQMDVSDNNKKQVVTFGHPCLVSVPNQISGRTLHQLLKPVMPLHSPEVHLALVNAQGKLCSRCIFNTHCHGCIRLEAEDDKEVILQINDTIAITYTDLSPRNIEAFNATEQDESVNRPRIKEKLSLEDCLEAFSKTEDLDEHNPWFCPMCRKNQCATKTLTVWRFPDYLIIYLKRFVFMNTSAGALKLEKDVEFKVTDLDLTPFLSGPLQADSRPVFNMYGCVCHFGSVYGGHYTAFSRHLGNLQWNYFDDGSVNERKVPGEAPGDFASAYILFYQRAGSRQDTQIPMLNRKCRAFALSDVGRCNGSQSKDGPDPNPSSPSSTTITSTLDTNELMVDEEEDSLQKPDLSQIIRSLDTPPPSS